MWSMWYIGKKSKIEILARISKKWKMTKIQVYIKRTFANAHMHFLWKNIKVFHSFTWLKIFQWPSFILQTDDGFQVSSSRKLRAFYASHFSRLFTLSLRVKLHSVKRDPPVLCITASPLGLQFTMVSFLESTRKNSKWWYKHHKH